jgi:hypothetical protein
MIAETLVANSPDPRSPDPREADAQDSENEVRALKKQVRELEMRLRKRDEQRPRSSCALASANRKLTCDSPLSPLFASCVCISVMSSSESL